jgi:hypothetical protein
VFKTYLFLSSRAGDPFTGSGDAAARQLARLCPAAVGYVQSRALAEQLDAVAVPAYSGIAELWFADPADARAAVAQVGRFAPLWVDGSAAVAAQFTGQERVVMRLPEHHEGRFIKGVFPFRRKAGLSAAEFQRAWWHGHGPIAARTERALAYLQCHALPAGADEVATPWHAITELHWRDAAAARSAMASRQMREDQASDAERFVEPGSVGLLLVEPEVVIAP